MAELKCGAENCMYNKECMCCKGDIMVGGKHASTMDATCCDSFHERREGHESVTSSTNHPCKTISIDCEAVKCIYNTDYHCKAEHVDIKGAGATSAKETVCGTFREA